MRLWLPTQACLCLALALLGPLASAQQLSCDACAVVGDYDDGGDVAIESYSAAPETAEDDTPTEAPVGTPSGAETLVPVTAPAAAVSQFTGNVTAVPPATPLAPSLSEEYDTSLVFGTPNVEYWNAAIGQFATAPSVGLLNTSETAGTESGSTTVIGKGISNGYTLPQSKQGINDQRYMTSAHITASWPAERAARYKVLKAAVNPGVKRYNVFWQQLESSSVQPSTSPLKCPNGYIQVPANAAEKAAGGFNKYHCWTYAILDDMDSYLALDAANGIESAVVMWTAPSWAIHSGCLGSTTVGTQSCAPRSDAIWAWQDYSALLAFRWKGGSAGRFSHFIVWNEADSPAWFDLSPEAYDIRVHVAGTAAGTTIINRYAAMMTATHAAIKQNAGGKPAMMYACVDRMWTESPWCPGPRWGSRCPIGAVNLLDGLWNVLGTKIDWSLAVHAYGDPTASDWALTQPYQAYTFADLPHVRDYQLAKLRAAKAAYPTLAPQAMLAATEQGWTTSNPTTTALTAKYVCACHAIATAAGSNIVWVAHNDFQDVYNPYSGSYGIVPLASGDALANVAGVTPPGLAAYQATNIANWQRNRQHYCCSKLGVGCS